MSKIKLLSIVIIILIIINMATLSFFFIKGSRPMNRPEPKEIIIKKLHFDKNQTAVYESLIKVHSNKIMLLNQAVMETKNKLYSALSKPENKKTTDSLFSQLAFQQNEIEKKHYDHFLDIKKLCNQEQSEDFNKLTIELAEIFSSKLPKPRHER